MSGIFGVKKTSISIHALREESDRASARALIRSRYFNPRSP